MNGHHHCDCHEGHHHHNSNEESKYQYVLNEYPAVPTDEEIAKAVKKAGETAEKNNTKE